MLQPEPTPKTTFPYHPSFWLKLPPKALPCPEMESAASSSLGSPATVVCSTCSSSISSQSSAPSYVYPNSRAAVLLTYWRLSSLVLHYIRDADGLPTGSVWTFLLPYCLCVVTVGQSMIILDRVASSIRAFPGWAERPIRYFTLWGGKRGGAVLFLGGVVIGTLLAWTSTLLTSFAFNMAVRSAQGWSFFDPATSSCGKPTLPQAGEIHTGFLNCAGRTFQSVYVSNFTEQGFAGFTLLGCLTSLLLLFPCAAFLSIRKLNVLQFLAAIPALVILLTAAIYPLSYSPAVRMPTLYSWPDIQIWTDLGLWTSAISQALLDVASGTGIQLCLGLRHQKKHRKTSLVCEKTWHKSMVGRAYLSSDFHLLLSLVLVLCHVSCGTWISLRSTSLMPSMSEIFVLPLVMINEVASFSVYRFSCFTYCFSLFFVGLFGTGVCVKLMIRVLLVWQPTESLKCRLMDSSICCGTLLLFMIPACFGWGWGLLSAVQHLTAELLIPLATVLELVFVLYLPELQFLKQITRGAQMLIWTKNRTKEKIRGSYSKWGCDEVFEADELTYQEHRMAFGISVTHLAGTIVSFALFSVAAILSMCAAGGFYAPIIVAAIATTLLLIVIVLPSLMPCLSTTAKAAKMKERRKEGVCLSMFADAMGSPSSKSVLWHIVFSGDCLLPQTMMSRLPTVTRLKLEKPSCNSWLKNLVRVPNLMRNMSSVVSDSSPSAGWNFGAKFLALFASILSVTYFVFANVTQGYRLYAPFATWKQSSQLAAKLTATDAGFTLSSRWSFAAAAVSWAIAAVYVCGAVCLLLQPRLASIWLYSPKPPEYLGPTPPVMRRNIEDVLWLEAALVLGDAENDLEMESQTA